MEEHNEVEAILRSMRRAQELHSCPCSFGVPAYALARHRDLVMEVDPSLYPDRKPWQQRGRGFVVNAPTPDDIQDTRRMLDAMVTTGRVTERRNGAFWLEEVAAGPG